MKIYLSSSAPPSHNDAHKWVSSLEALDMLVSTSEASSIICDRFLSTIEFDRLEEALKIIISKMRIGCELLILNPDISVLSQRFVGEEIDLLAMNEILFKNGPIKSVTPIETIEQLLPPNVNIFSKHFDLFTSEIIIKARRSS